MSDKREDIIYDCLDGESDGWTTSFGIEEVKRGMDLYATQMCLELLEYMAKNGVEIYYDKQEGASFKVAPFTYLTKEQLFENFL